MPRARRPKPLKLGRTEKQVTAEVLDLAACFGLELERRNVGLAFAGSRAVQFGKPGDPDWELTRMPEGWANRGRRVSIELKREGFKPPTHPGEKKRHFDEQIRAMKAINAAGGLATWLDSASAFRTFLVRLETQADLRIELEDGWPVMIYGEGESA